MVVLGGFRTVSGEGYKCGSGIRVVYRAQCTMLVVRALTAQRSWPVFCSLVSRGRRSQGEIDWVGESAFHERYSNASPVPALPKSKRWKAQLP